MVVSEQEIMLNDGQEKEELNSPARAHFTATPPNRPNQCHRTPNMLNVPAYVPACSCYSESYECPGLVQGPVSFFLMALTGTYIVHLQ